MKQWFLKLSLTGLAFYAMCWPIHVDAATVTWVGESGDWDTATNWSTGALPGPTDNVVIPGGPSITVTHSIGLDTVNSVQSQQAFVLSGGTFTVSNTFEASNSFTLSGGTLQNATVLTTNGASLIVNGSGGTLDRVTINGVLDVGNSFQGASLTVTNGLVLDGTALIGNPTNFTWYGQLLFAGSQTLNGNGTVAFGNETYGNNNVLGVVNAGTTLTIAPRITVGGQNGTIGFFGRYGSPQNVAVINQGTISANVSGGTIAIIAEPLVNSGALEMSSGGSLNINYMTNVVGVSATGSGTLTLNGNWQNTGLLSGGRLP